MSYSPTLFGPKTQAQAIDKLDEGLAVSASQMGKVVTIKRNGPNIDPNSLLSVERGLELVSNVRNKINHAKSSSIKAEPAIDTNQANATQEAVANNNNRYTP